MTLHRQASHMIATVRRGSKRSSLNAVSVESPTHGTLPNAKARGASPPRPSREKTSQERPSLLRPRRSKRNNSLPSSNPSTDDLADGGVGNHNALAALAQPSALEMIPSHWETASGKFDPRKSEFAFDNTSNVAININLKSGFSTNSLKSGSNDSEYSHKSRLSDDTEPKTNKHKSKKGETSAPMEGEFVDHVERHQFYKKLKKVGIKKTLAIDEDWTNSSACSGVSELSSGNASYILDLAQQKESRKKDREEAALEEALELYGTWLTEGKNDDKNIFLMILQEVKKEQKAKYRKADKRHAALLNAALDEELKRRAQIKEEEEEEEERRKAVAAAAEAEAAQKKEPETKPVSEDGVTAQNRHRRHEVVRGSLTRKSFHSKKSESKIVEILTTQSFMSNNNDKESSDGSFHEEPSEDFEHAESSEIYDNDVPKPSSKRSRSRSRSRNGRRSGIFSRFGSNAKKMDQSHLRQSDPQMYANSPPHNEKEDSRRMFSRLRRQLSAREFEQRKEEEKSWKKNDRVVTNEEKWWSKINDAKKEDVMFEKAKLDMTTRSSPFGGKSPKKTTTAVKLDLTTRTDPGRMPNTKNANNSTDNPSNFAELTVTSTATSPTAETEKKVKDEKKKLSSPKKKKKVTSVSDLLDEPKEVNSEKKKKKKKRVSEIGDSSSVVSDFDVQKSPKSKDKKKKKKSKVVQGDEKKEKTSKGRSKNVNVIGSVDGSDAKSSSRSGRKKKIKGSVGENSDAETSPTKKSHNKIAKKKEKKAKSSVDSASDDAIHGENHGANLSCDWTHRSINPAPSDETGSATVLTMESTLQ